jgi:hypothetical protein
MPSETLKRYRDFQPTGFDVKELGLRDQQDWYIAPCMRTRDSDLLEESNWDCQLNALGGKSDTVQIHRFGHWGPGWFELVLISPDDEKAVKIAEEIDGALSGYPVLDDEDFSDREFEAADNEAESIAQNLDYERFDGLREAFEYALAREWPSEYRDGYTEVLRDSVIAAYKAFRREQRRTA